VSVAPEVPHRGQAKLRAITRLYESGRTYLPPALAAVIGLNLSCNPPTIFGTIRAIVVSAIKREIFTKPVGA
jgi:hypothetical protein